MPALLTLLVDALLFLAAGWYGYQGQTSLCVSILSATVFLVLWQCTLSGALRAAGEKARVENGLRSPHYIQAILTFSIYLYWSRYWDDVVAYAPLIVVQLVFAYGFEMLLSWSRHHVWRAGFGPFPIVFSINLFLWFKPDWYVLQFLLLMLTYIGKDALRWTRNGRKTHIFNPSGFSLTVVVAILLMTGTALTVARGVDIVGSFELPPNFFEVLFCLSLVVQLLYRTAPVTLGAMATLAILHEAATVITGIPINDVPINPSVFLGLTFLVTDPSTSPRSTSGKLLYGTTYGLGVFIACIILRMSQQPSFVDKIILVPVVNLLARFYDRVGCAIDGRIARFVRVPAIVGPRYTFVLLNIATFLCVVPALKSPYLGPVPDFFPPAVSPASPLLNQELANKNYCRTVLPQPYQPFGFRSELADYHRIRTIYKQGTYQNPIEDYSEAIRRDPEYALAYFERGRAYVDTGEPEKAIEDLSAAIRLDPENEEAYVERGIAHGMKGRLNDAIADFTTAIQLKPGFAEAYYNRGLAYQMKGDHTNANADFDRAKENGLNLGAVRQRRLNRRPL